MMRMHRVTSSSRQAQNSNDSCIADAGRAGVNPGHWPTVVQLLLAFAAGALGVLGFAPFAIGLLGVLSLALLFLLWRYARSTALAAWIGYAYGLGLMGFGVTWVRISIAQFGGVTMPLAVAITTAFVLFMAAYFAVAGWLVGRLRGRSEAVWLVLVMPAVWVLVEWLRGWLFTGFPWLAIGYSQIDLPLAGYAPLAGVYAISLAVALSAALLNLLPRPAAALGLILVWGAALGVQQISWSEPAGQPLRVSLLQGNIAQDQKWRSAMLVPTLQLYLDMTEAAADSRIVVWPETAVPAFASEVEDELLQPLHARLREQGRDVLLGVVDGERDGAYYNAMLSLGASGRGHYYKRHLVPFGEYLPFDRWLRPLLDFLHIPMSDFSPGNGGKPLVSLAGYPVGVDICYEDAYAGEIIRALPEAMLLINASNDAWFGDSLAPHQHLEIARMRALETGRYLLRATNTGISAIIDQRGRLVATAPQFERAVLTRSVVPLQGQTPFARWGNLLVVALAGLMLGLGMLRQRAGD